MIIKKMNDRKNSKKEYYESAEGRNYLTYLYRDLHMTDEQVAKEIGVTRRTIINWRQSSKVIDQAINLGKQYTDTLVENSLLQQALKGNVNAAIYWLRNRKPDKWNNDIRNTKEKEEMPNITIIDEWIKKDE